MVERLSVEVAGRFFPEAGGSTVALKRRADDLFVDSGFHLRSRERLRDKLDYLRLYSTVRLRRMVTPNHRDHEFMTLPEKLGFLYYLVRPVRLAGSLFQRWGRLDRSMSDAELR